MDVTLFLFVHLCNYGRKFIMIWTFRIGWLFHDENKGEGDQQKKNIQTNGKKGY